jgi:hypothetical protein
MWYYIIDRESAQHGDCARLAHIAQQKNSHSDKMWLLFKVVFTVTFFFSSLIFANLTHSVDVHKLALELRRRISGEVYLKGSPEYEIARPVHNGACRNIYPLMIVRPFYTEDVSVTVEVSVSYGLELSVRSGGHSFQCQGTKVNNSLHVLFVC